MSGEFLYSGPKNGPVLVLAHGADAAADSAFMQAVANGMATHGIRVVRFDFEYMQRALRTARRQPPSPVHQLVQEYRDVILRLQAEGSKRLVIGGKSMGGRVASLLIQQEDCPPAVVGCACLGYPFHPQGKPHALRTAHLQELRRPLLIVQGERDGFGSKAEVTEYLLDQQIGWLWLAEADHDFRPRQRSGLSQEQHLEQTCARLAEFVRQLTA